MISLTYDLHIHSCLSPCGDDDMTPANIAGMCAIKGLDVVALTDHNSSKNCPAFLAAAEEYGLLAIPGMEINTSEEVHAVCLFPTLEAAMDFAAQGKSMIALMNGAAPDVAKQVRPLIEQQAPDGEIVVDKQITATMAVHTGPGLIGIGVMLDD